MLTQCLRTPRVLLTGRGPGDVDASAAFPAARHRTAIFSRPLALPRPLTHGSCLHKHLLPNDRAKGYPGVEEEGVVVGTLGC